MPKISVILDFDPEECSQEAQKRIANSPELLMKLLPMVWENSLGMTHTIKPNNIKFEFVFPSNTLLYKMNELLNKIMS